jgi:hypothetical protein
VAMLSVEGMNKSAISRVKKIGWNTVHRWLERAGEACRNYSNKTLKGFEIKELQADELCTFVGSKKKARPVQILDRSLIASLVSGYEWSLGCWKCSDFGYSRCLVG